MHLGLHLHKTTEAVRFDVIDGCHDDTRITWQSTQVRRIRCKQQVSRRWFGLVVLWMSLGRVPMHWRVGI